MNVTPELVNAFEAFMWERFGVEPGIAEDGTHYYERWQVEEALDREIAKRKPATDHQHGAMWLAQLLQAEEEGR